MGKLPKAEVARRERFMYEIFKKDPELSAAKANLLLKDEFGEQMRPQRVYAIKEMARDGKSLDDEVRRGPGRPAKGTQPKDHHAPVSRPSYSSGHRESPRVMRAAREGSTVTSLSDGIGGAMRTAKFAVVSADAAQTQYLAEVFAKIREAELGDLHVYPADDKFAVIGSPK